MIYGIGTDIVSVVRMERALARHGEPFAERLLGEQELQEFHAAARPARFIAKRFAAKEAAAKAMGTGFRNGLALRHICVVHDELGKPLLEFHGKGLELLNELGIGETFVSVSDEHDVAIAFVTLMKRTSDK